jgi:hypothetical protein
MSACPWETGLKTLFIIAALLASVLTAEPTVAQTERYTVEQVQADFIQLYTDLEIAHYDLYANVSEAEYQAEFDRLYQGIDRDMTELEARIYFQRFVAFGDIAHATLDLPIPDFLAYAANDGPVIPLLLSFDGQTATIDRLHGTDPFAHAGQSLLSINGQPTADWIEALSAFIAADNQAMANTLIDRLFPLVVWLESGDRDHYTLQIQTDNGIVEQTLPAITFGQFQDLAAGPASDDAQPAASEPRQARMLDHNIAYLRPGPFSNLDETSDDNWDATRFHAFIDQSFEQFIAADATALLMDLRDNPGGSNSFSDHMLAWIIDQPFRFASDFSVRVSPQAQRAIQARLANSTEPNSTDAQLLQRFDQLQTGDRFSFDLPFQAPRDGARFTAPVYVLIDRYSYSNAVSVAAILQDYDAAIVLGEPTTDLATTYAAMEHFTLDQTGLRVGFPKALIVRPNGNRQPAGVTPDHALGADTDMLRQAVNLIGASTED